VTVGSSPTTGWSTPASRSSAKSASTSSTSIRQLAVPLRNDSAPERVPAYPCAARATLLNAPSAGLARNVPSGRHWFKPE
jgi:hypothetical protein